MRQVRPCSSHFLATVKLGEAAPAAGDGDEPLVLHVEDLGQIPAGGLELVVVKLVIAALGATVLILIHGSLSFLPGTGWFQDML